MIRVTINGEPRSLDDGLTVAALVELLGLAGKPVAVERNRLLVPKARHAGERLCEGDCLEVVTLVGGG